MAGPVHKEMAGPVHKEMAGAGVVAVGVVLAMGLVLLGVVVGGHYGLSAWVFFFCGLSAGGAVVWRGV